MKRFIGKILNFLKGLLLILFVFIIFPFCRLFLSHKKIWLVSENELEGRDNGYVFFKYIRENHKTINCYYPINFKSKDYAKISKLGNVIKFGSFKHYIYFCAAKYNISSKSEGFFPSYFLQLLKRKLGLFGTYIFLQHGITKDDQVHFYKKKAKFDLFICGAKPEYADIHDKYGYQDNEVAYTGLARFDAYHDLKSKNQILIMPTWRRGINKDNILESDYFQTWNKVINSQQINELLIKYGIYAFFYIHPQFQKYSEYFKTHCSNIVVASFNNYDVQVLIRESKMLITDFSSVFFDFGYMKRPVIYFQYDEDTFFGAHYIKGYFDYRRDGFGPVCNTFDDFVNKLQLYIKNDCKMDDDGLKNHEIFFPLYDNKNCQRIYDAIIKIKD